MRSGPAWYMGAMPTLLERTRLVLIRPSLPDNVGAVARSMANFGLKELVLVEGVSPTHPQAIALAAGHEAVLHAARQVATLDQALAGTVFSVGTTARAMPGVDRQPVMPDEGARLAREHAGAGPVALVFGTEKSGMTNAELKRCHQVITIPGEAEACLNLAMAAAICTYEWRLAALEAGEALRPATAVAAEEGLEDLAGWIASGLVASGAMRPQDRESKQHTLRRILSRTRLTPEEAAMLQGLMRAVTKNGREADESKLND